jgi:hypothetical protein
VNALVAGLTIRRFREHDKLIDVIARAEAGERRVRRGRAGRRGAGRGNGQVID